MHSPASQSVTDLLNALIQKYAPDSPRSVTAVATLRMNSDGTANMQTRWWATAISVYEFASEHDSLPTPKDGFEPRVASWIKNQRRARTLEPMQEALLFATPGWAFDPHQAKWEQRLDAVRSFLEANGRLPHPRASDTDERSLGRWLQRQESAIHKRNLPYIRAGQYAALMASIPHFRGDSRL